MMSLNFNRFLKQAAITAALSGIAVTGFGSSNTTNTFTVAEDTFASQPYSNNTYGAFTELQLREDASSIWTRTPYLKFNVSALQGPVDQALLHIYTLTELDVVNALEVNDNSWSENTLNWNNRPATGAVISNGQASVAGSWFSIDVSPYIISNGTYSIALDEQGNSYHQIASKEGGFGAYLEVMTSVVDALSPPSGLTVTGGYETVMLDWDDNVEPTLDHYIIRRSDNGVDYAQIGTSAVSSFTDTNAKLYETYYYTVAASDGGWYESAPSSPVTGEVGDPFTGDYISGIESLVDDVENGTDPWRIAADARIDQYRKSDLTVHVVDALGNPVPGADVTVKLQRHDFQFGCYMDSRRFVGSSTYPGVSSNAYQQAFLDFGFNLSGLALGMKPIARKNTAAWSLVHNVDPWLAWCATNAIDVRGHNLIWPGWQFMPEESYALSNNPTALETYCSNLVVQGAEWWPVVEWDVINEPRVNRDVQEIIGFDAETDWFNIAEANVINTNTLLVLNENKVISDPNGNVTQTANINSYMATLDGLIANNAPVHALGFQTRFRKMLNADLIYDRLNLFTNYNLPIAATELEIVHDTIPDELDKAIMTERAMTVYFSHPLVYEITGWTFMEKNVNDYRQLINLDLSLTLQGKTWLYLMKNRWHTDVTKQANLGGEVNLRGFKGDYRVTVSYDGVSQEQTFSLGDAAGDLTVVLSGVTNTTPTAVLVDYQFDDPADTQLTQLQNDGIMTVNWASDASNAVYTTGTGFLRTVTNEAAPTISRDLVLDTPLTNGLVEFQWRMDSWNHSGLSGDGGVGFGLAGVGAAGATDVLSKFVLRNSLTESRVQMRDANGTYRSQMGFPVSGSDPIDIRVSLNLDERLLTMEYSTNATDWVDVTPVETNGLDRVDRIYFQVFGADWSGSNGAFVDLDSMSLTAHFLQLTPEERYAQWLAEFPGLGSTNIEDNLIFYAVDANPTNPVGTGNWPEFQTLETGIEYIHYEWTDADARGLTYTVETTDDLVGGTWVTNGLTFIGSGEFDAEFTTVTNRLPTTGTNGFIRVNIGFTP